MGIEASGNTNLFNTAPQPTGWEPQADAKYRQYISTVYNGVANDIDPTAGSEIDPNVGDNIYDQVAGVAKAPDPQNTPNYNQAEFGDEFFELDFHEALGYVAFNGVQAHEDGSYNLLIQKPETGEPTSYHVTAQGVPVDPNRPQQ